MIIYRSVMSLEIINVSANWNVTWTQKGWQLIVCFALCLYNLSDGSFHSLIAWTQKRLISPWRYCPLSLRLSSKRNSDFWLQQELKKCQSLSVCLSILPSGPSLSKGLNLLLFFMITSWQLHDDFMMTSWWLQDDFRMTSGWLQDDFRMTSGWL